MTHAVPASLLVAALALSLLAAAPAGAERLEHGLLVGFGTRLGNGCTSGHGISGTMQLAVSSWISAICFFMFSLIVITQIFRKIYI